DAGDLSFAESATTTSRQANTDGSTMATTSADATELATMTTLVTDAATAGEEDSATTAAAAMIEQSAYGSPSVADDLALLKSDPSALGELGAPVDATTPCLAEATAALGTEELLSFSYSAPGDDATKYQVFYLRPVDGSNLMVAFDPADCTTPISVP
ncbi:MAG: hypothetical protein AAB198_04405, partial [Actinomycetota bacterium]